MRRAFPNLPRARRRASSPFHLALLSLHLNTGLQTCSILEDYSCNKPPKKYVATRNTRNIKRWKELRIVSCTEPSDSKDMRDYPGRMVQE